MKRTTNANDNRTATVRCDVPTASGLRPSACNNETPLEARNAVSLLKNLNSPPSLYGARRFGTEVRNRCASY
ncbi:unnamed protein product [Leptosia nina]|uniref:Uncharacterized protein n=1 Tax=Leptosia nina TaxID=320188 RepID=A0AAV1J5Q4_9NEOP